MRFSWFFRVTREWCNKLLSPASNWVIDCMKKSQKTCVIIYFCGVTLLFRWLISRILAMALNCSVLYGSIFRKVHHTFITAQFPSCTKNPPPNNTPWLMPPPTGALVVLCLGARVCIGSLPAAVCWGLGDPSWASQLFSWWVVRLPLQSSSLGSCALGTCLDYGSYRPKQLFDYKFFPSAVDADGLLSSTHGASGWYRCLSLWMWLPEYKETVNWHHRWI